MSLLKTRVGSWKMEWKSVPRGSEGVVQVLIPSGDCIEVRWRRDPNGIWISLPQGVYGYDLRREWDENAQVLYQVSQRGVQAEWVNIPFFHGEEEAQRLNSGTKAKSIRVRAPMPGKIIRVRVEEGQMIEKDQPTVVMEAMKMENEIRAPQTGRVSQVKVKEGQTVETGADLFLIEPEAI